MSTPNIAKLDKAVSKMGDRDVPVALFEEEIAKVTRILGRDHGINVVFQGNEARTEGTTVYFPVLDQGAALPPDKVRIGRGYVDHEAAHLRLSNMALLEEMNHAAMKKGDHLFANVMNALEDVRLESFMIKEYPGSQKNLEATSEAVYAHFLREHGSDTKLLTDRKAMAGLALTIAGRSAMGYTSPAMMDLWSKLDPKLQAEAQSWIKLLGVCRKGRDGTEDVVNITKKIVHDLRYEPEEDEEEGIGDGGDGNDAGGTGSTGSGSGSGADKTSGADTGTSTKVQETYEARHVEIEGTTGYSGGGGGIGSDGGSREALVVPEDFDFEDDGTRPPSGGLPFTEIFGDAMKATRNSYRPFSKVNDKLHTAYDEPDKYNYGDGHGNQTLGLKLRHAGGSRNYQDTLNKAIGKVNVIRRKLHRMLVSKMQRDWDGMKEEGRLDTRRFVAAVNGRTDIFKQRKDAPEIDTAVMLLVDLSGSMRGDKAYLAQQAAILLTEALSMIVPVAVMGFNTTTSFSGETAKALRDARFKGEAFSRTEPIDMYMFKNFTENLRMAKNALGNITLMVGGANCDGESVMYAYQELAKRQEKRKVLMVLSDGYPACSSDLGANHLSTHLAKVVRIIQKKGTDVIGIGIMSDAVKQFYPKYVVLKKVEDLSGTVLDQIGKSLLGERVVMDNSMLIRV